MGITGRVYRPRRPRESPLFRLVEQQKQRLWADWLREELFAPVAHRHVVLTIPRLLRPLFRRRRDLQTSSIATPSQESSSIQKLLAWRHPGFSVHVGERIDREDKQRLCDTPA